MKDFRHASRLYIDDNFKLVPKQKFLFHVVLTLNDVVTQRKFTPNEKKEVYEKLVRKAKTTFHPEYNVYSYEDIVRAYQEIAQIPPDFKTFPSTMETHTVEAELREKILEPFSGSLSDTLYKIVSQIDNNVYSNQFVKTVLLDKIIPLVKKKY